MPATHGKRPRLHTFDQVLHQIDQVKDTNSLKLLYDILYEKKSVIDADKTFNSMRNDHHKFIHEFYLLAAYAMDNEKSMHTLSKDNDILRQSEPSIPWMKQCLYGDATDNWLSVLKNPDDNVELINHKILDWFGPEDMHKLSVILDSKFSKLCNIYSHMFTHGSMDGHPPVLSISMLCDKIEHFLDTTGIAPEIGNARRECFTGHTKKRSFDKANK